MPCSLCKQPGHNKTTCHKEYSTSALASSTKETLSKLEQHDSVAISKINSTDNNVCSFNICDTNKSLNGRIVLKNHSVKNYESSETKTEPNNNKIINDNYDVVDKNKNVIKVKENGVDSTLNISKRNNDFKISAVKDQVNQTESSNNKIAGRVESKSPSKNGRSNENDDNQRISGNCIAQNVTTINENAINSKKPPRTNKIELPKISSINDEQRVNHAESSNKATVNKSWKDIKIRDGDKDVLCKQGMIRFFEGPSADEGEGYIYMYTYFDTDDHKSKIESIFKIGMTKDLPKRRIDKTGYANKEKYFSVYSDKVAWRRLAEQLIHKQLTVKGYHAPREGIKGGTEWFKGKKDEIIDVIRLVIRFLNVYGLPLE